PVGQGRQGPVKPQDGNNTQKGRWRALVLVAAEAKQRREEGLQAELKRVRVAAQLVHTEAKDWEGRAQKLAADLHQSAVLGQSWIAKVSASRHQKSLFGDQASEWAKSGHQWMLASRHWQALCHQWQREAEGWKRLVEKHGSSVNALPGVTVSSPVDG